MILKKLLSALLLLATLTISYAGSVSNYENLINMLDHHWGQNEFQMLSDLIEENEANYPDKAFELASYQIVALGNLNRQKEGLKIISKWHDSGYFFFLAENHPWFKNYDGVDGFKDAIKKNKLLLEEHNQSATTQYEVVLPKNYDKNTSYPLLYVFHGGMGNISGAKNRWQSDFVSEKFIAVYLQSKYYVTSESGSWANDEATQNDLKGINTEIFSKYKIQPDNVLVGGMSNGGMMALLTVFESIIHVNGFIVNCPVIPDSIGTEEVNKAHKQHKKGVIITGSNDWSLPKQKNLKTILDEAGFTSKMTIIEGLGHQFPDHFADLLEESMKEMFIK